MLEIVIGPGIRTRITPTWDIILLRCNKVIAVRDRCDYYYYHYCYYYFIIIIIIIMIIIIGIIIIIIIICTLLTRYLYCPLCITEGSKSFSYIMDTTANSAFIYNLPSYLKYRS